MLDTELSYKSVLHIYEQCKRAKCQSYASLDDDDVLGRLQNLDKICKEIDCKLYSTSAYSLDCFGDAITRTTYYLFDDDDFYPI